MPFRTFCNSTDKTCRQEVEPLVDKKLDKVYCPECDLEITVDPFMKRQLVSMGQVVRESQEKKPYAIKCTKCNRKKTPLLGPKRQIICSICKEDITDTLSGPFVQMLREALSKKNV